MQPLRAVLFCIAGQDALQAGFRIDEELAGGNDRLTFLETGQHLQTPIGLAAQGDFLGAVASVAFGQHHQCTLAGANHGFTRHKKRGLFDGTVQAYGGEHAGAQLTGRVG